MELTKDKLAEILNEAKAAAYKAANDHFQIKLGGRDQYACGFAATRIYGYRGKPLRGNSKIGKALKAAGVDQNYHRVFEIWNPSKFPAQNVDVLEAGARAAARVFESHGFEAAAWSRLD
jgi:hypothetical protein